MYENAAEYFVLPEEAERKKSLSIIPLNFSQNTALNK